jgi:hypothetical protein
MRGMRLWDTSTDSIKQITSFYFNRISSVMLPILMLQRLEH